MIASLDQFDYGEEAPAEQQQMPLNTYVHQMLTPFRAEPHYKYFNPRHVTI